MIFSMEDPKFLIINREPLDQFNHSSSNGILPFISSDLKRRLRYLLMENERDLLKELRSLDPQAITEVHNRFFTDVYRYACYRIEDKSKAEDFASETFTRMIEAFHSKKGPKSSLRGWLIRTVSNIINDYYRVVYSRPVSELTNDIEDKNNLPDTSLEKADQNQIVRLALRELTPDQQHVLALRFGSGYSLAEASDIMGKKPNAIKQLQYRALAALRRQLGDEFNV